MLLRLTGNLTFADYRLVNVQRHFQLFDSGTAFSASITVWPRAGLRCFRADVLFHPERQLIPQYEAFAEIIEISGIVMGFRWRPDGCPLVFRGPAGV